MSETELAEIEARANAATPGPWRWMGPFENERELGDKHYSIFWPDCGNGAHVFRQNDADFIAAARTDIPALIASLRAAMKALKGLVDQLDVVHNSPEYLGVWTLSQLHGGYYKGPTYTDALAAARAALKSE